MQKKKKLLMNLFLKQKNKKIKYFLNNQQLNYQRNNYFQLKNKLKFYKQN